MRLRRKLSREFSEAASRRRCMADADIAWGRCKNEYAGLGVGALWELVLGICNGRKEADEQKCRNDDARRRGLLPPSCTNDGG